MGAHLSEPGALIVQQAVAWGERDGLNLDGAA
jgi:hypothetical protein